MNTGLVDAIVLGKLLTRVMREGAPDATLDAYGRMRRPAAIEVLGLARRLTRMATARSLPGRMLRNALLRLIDALPMARRRLIMSLSGLSRKRYAEMG
jgi:2-polyprenyl-6-methoxyphenol hydroxylase-like FAD-dependent oxidoreductase